MILARSTWTQGRVQRVLKCKILRFATAPHRREAKHGVFSSLDPPLVPSCQQSITGRYPLLSVQHLTVQYLRMSWGLVFYYPWMPLFLLTPLKSLGFPTLGRWCAPRQGKVLFILEYLFMTPRLKRRLKYRSLKGTGKVEAWFPPPSLLLSFPCTWLGPPACTTDRKRGENQLQKTVIAPQG